MIVSALASAGWFGVSLVTLLGDPLVLAGLGLGAFRFGDRLPAVGDRLESRRHALAFATIVGALALSAALKAGFGLTRLPGAADLPGVAGMPDAFVPIYTWIVGPGGHAFPSGHATAATVGWLGLAWAFRGKHRNRTLFLAGCLIAAISASRIALGVHRPHEVLAGVAVGLAYLLVAFGVLGTPRRAFALAGLFGVVGPVTVGLTGDGLLAAAVALGTAVGWEPTRRRGAAVSTATALFGVFLLAGVTFVRSGLIQTGVALAGVGSGTAMVIGRNRGRDSKNE